MLFVVAVLAGTTLPASPTAQESVPQETTTRDAPTNAQIDEIISDIEDPETREALLQKLRTLNNAQADDTDEASAAPTGTIPIIDTQIDRMAETAIRLGEWVGRLPNVITWLDVQISDPLRQQYWINLAIQLLATLGTGVAIAGGARILWDRRDPGLETGPIHHAIFQTVREIISLTALVIAFGLAIYLFESDRRLPELVKFIGVGILAFRTIKLLTRLILAPGKDSARWLPISDQTAVLTSNWANRSNFLFVTGIALPYVLGALFLPGEIIDVVQHVVYFTLLIVSCIGLFRTLPELSSEIIPATRTRLHYWVGERGPFIGTLILIAAYVVWSLGFPGGAAFLIRAIGGSLLVLFLTFAFWQWIRPAETVRPVDPDDDEDDEFKVALKSRYATIAPQFLRGAVLIIALIALAELWKVGFISWLWSDNGRSVAAILIRISIVAVVALSIAEFASFWAGKYIKATDSQGRPVYSSRKRTLATFIRNLVLFGLAVFAIIFVLGQLGVDATALLAGAGVVGLAIGFGSQKLVQDLINGLFILLGDTIRVGDVVDIGGQAGVVEAMSMRTVTLRSYNGNLHTIPYSSIDAITNMTKDFSYADFNIGFGYGEHVDRVGEILVEIFNEMRRVREFRREILDEIEIAGVNELRDSAVVIKGRIKTKPGSQWMVRREFMRRVKLRFDELGIEIPFPQRTVHVVSSSGSTDQQKLTTGIEGAAES